MKAQRHGNASAMKIFRGGRKVGARCSVLALFALASMEMSGCAVPPKDGNGKRPSDVVRDFIELCEAEDYEGARELWYGPSELLPSVQIPFEDYCARYRKIGLEKCEIHKAVKGKAKFWHVRVDWEENGREKHVFEYLQIVDGEWKMERGYAW